MIPLPSILATLYPQTQLLLKCFVGPTDETVRVAEEEPQVLCRQSVSCHLCQHLPSSAELKRLLSQLCQITLQ